MCERGYLISVFALRGGERVHPNVNVCEKEGRGLCQCESSHIIFLNLVSSSLATWNNYQIVRYFHQNNCLVKRLT